MNSLAARLINARTEKGWSQAELAKAAGIRNQSTIGMLEAGRRLKSAYVPAIAAALGVQALWLAEGRGPRYLTQSQVLEPLTGHAEGSISHPPPPYPSGQRQQQGPPPLTADEQALLDAYRLLEPADREGLVAQLLEKAAFARRYMVKAQTQQQTSTDPD